MECSPTWASGEDMARGVGPGGEGVDQIRRAGGTAQRSDVVAVIEIPFKPGAVADAQDEVGFRQRLGKQRLERGGVGGEADAEIDMGCDDAGERTLFGAGGSEASGWVVKAFRKNARASSGSDG